MHALHAVSLVGVQLDVLVCLPAAPLSHCGGFSLVSLQRGCGPALPPMLYPPTQGEDLNKSEQIFSNTINFKLFSAL